MNADIVQMSHNRFVILSALSAQRTYAVDFPDFTLIQ
jgi:hypothetical protein